MKQGVYIESKLEFSSSDFQMDGSKALKSNVEDFLYKVVDKVKSTIALKNPSLTASQMPLRQFYDKEAGLFTEPLIGGFIKRGMIDTANSTVNVSQSKNLTTIDLNMPMEEESAKQFEDSIEKGKTGYLMQIAGGLDKKSASQRFDDAIGR